MIVTGVIVGSIIASYFLNRFQKKVIENKIAELSNIVIHNQQILSTNKEILKRVEIGSFQVKENMIWMYDHYRDLAIVLQNISPYDKDVLERVTQATIDGMNVISNTFTSTFHVTPEQYRQIKVKMTYTNKLGQSYPAPDAGVN